MKSWTTKSGQKINRILNGRCNCFLISYRNKHLLVDTGRESKWKKLSRELDNLGVNSSSLNGLILTHSHFDHAENAANIKKKFDTKIIIHKREADYLRSGENPAIHGTIFFTKFMTEGLYHKLLARYFRYKPADSDVMIEDYYDLRNLGFNGHLIHTPGHSPGSISVIMENEIAIVGDAMFGVFKGSVFPPFAADTGLMVRSWKDCCFQIAQFIFLPMGQKEAKRFFSGSIKNIKEYIIYDLPEKYLAQHQGHCNRSLRPG